MFTLGRVYGRFQLQRQFVPPVSSFPPSLVAPKLARDNSTRSAGPLPPPPSKHQASKTYPDKVSLLSSMSRAKSLNSSMEMLGSYKEPLSVTDQLQVFKVISKMNSRGKTNTKSSPLKNSETFQKLCSKITRDLHLLPLPDLVELLSYFAELRTSIKPGAADAVLSLIENDRNLSSIPSRDIGSIVNSLALLNIKTGRTKLIDGITAIISYRLALKTYDCHKWLKETCRGFAMLGRWPKELTDPVLRYLYRSIIIMDQYSVAIIIWSLQKCNIRFEDWLLEKTASLILESKQTDVVSHLLWVTGKSTHYYDKEFYDKIREILLSSDSRYWHHPRLLSHLLWMLAKVKHYDPVLLDRVAEIASPLLCRMQPQDLSNSVYAYGFFNHSSPALFDKLEELLVSYPNTYALQNSHAFANILWSFLVLELYPVPLIEQVFKDEFIKAFSHSFQTIIQLDNASMTNPHLCLPSLSPSQRSSILSQMLTVKHASFTSRFEKNITKTLNRLLYSLKGDSSNNEMLLIPEAYMPNGYSVDAEILLDANDNPIPPGNENFKWSIADWKKLCMEDVPVPQDRVSRIFHDSINSRDKGLYNISSGWIDGGKVAAAKRRISIEFEGPAHYSVNGSHQLGRSVIKRRQLEAFGWEFIQIPYYEWDPLGYNYTRQREYLKNKLFTKKEN